MTSIVDLVVLKRQKALTVGMEMAADAVCADLAKGFRFRAAWVVFEAGYGITRIARFPGPTTSA